MACCTVVIFSASSSGISVSNSSSSAMTSSTVSSESAPRSSTNDDSFLISASLTPSCSATIFLTRCSTFSMHLLPCEGSTIETDGFYQSLPPLSIGTTEARFERSRVRISTTGLSQHQHPAIHVQRRTRDVTCPRTGQKEHGIRDVVRRAEPTQRNAGQQRVALRLRQLLGHLRIDEPGCHAIDGDVTTADFERQRFREPDQRRFSRRIVRLAGVARAANDRPDLDDPPAARLHHAAKHALREGERRLE